MTNLATYLNDHLAGSVAAVELLEHLEETHAGTDVGRFLAELRAEVEADREELNALMARLAIDESVMRKTTAWLAGKLTDLKLRLDDSEGGELRLFESLEALSLGIEGKRLLWIAMAAAAKDAPKLRLIDYERLAQRAEGQRNRVEGRRLEAGKLALLATDSEHG
jgi:predicted nuclease with TOPRIM domain